MWPIGIGDRLTDLWPDQVSGLNYPRLFFPFSAGKKLPAKYHVFVDIFAWMLALAGLAFTLVLPTIKVIYMVLERFYRWVQHSYIKRSIDWMKRQIDLPFPRIHSLLKPLHPENLLEAIAGLLTWYVSRVCACIHRSIHQATDHLKPSPLKSPSSPIQQTTIRPQLLWRHLPAGGGVCGGLARRLVGREQGGPGRALQSACVACNDRSAVRKCSVVD